VAYTSPTTRSTGNSVSAANWNADVVNNIKWLAGESGSKPFCRAYNSAAILVATATSTALTFNSERFDNAGMHSTVSNTSRITVPAGGAGQYLFGGSVAFAGNATGQRVIEIMVNGTTLITRKTALGLSADECGMETVTMYPMAVGDYVELRVYQNSGGNLNVVVGGAYSPEFWAMWMAL
jgi:hypothetical protein